MSDRKLEMGNFRVRNVNDLKTGEWTQEVLQMDKCQHRTSDSLLPEDSFTSFVLPDLALTRKSSRSPRPDTASNLVMEPQFNMLISIMDYGHLGIPFAM